MQPNPQFELTRYGRRRKPGPALFEPSSRPGLTPPASAVSSTAALDVPAQEEATELRNRWHSTSGHLEKLALAWPWAPSTPFAAVGLSSQPARNSNFSRCPSGNRMKHVAF